MIKKTLDGKTKISINIPERLLVDLDLNRQENKQNRSNWITSAIMEKLSLVKKEKLAQEKFFQLN